MYSRASFSGDMDKEVEDMCWHFTGPHRQTLKQLNKNLEQNNLMAIAMCQNKQLKQEIY